MKRNTTNWEHHPITLIILLFLSTYITSSLFSWVLNKLEETRNWRMEYMYCDDCSNPDRLSCSYLRQENPEFKEDLCRIQKYNGKYRKTIYEK